MAMGREMEHIDKNMQCEGNCIKKHGRHSGDIKHVTVSGWGKFFYCDNAIKDDISMGLVVEIINHPTKSFITTPRMLPICCVQYTVGPQW